ncbi:MAG: hypothetical protein GF350_06485 [Chitinivibrionales bacterium]|nr:hypothetical protein [Chitinivibrionales bacterium]
MMDSCDFETGAGLYLSEAGGIDTIAGPPTDTLPPVYHTGSGTVWLYTNDLICDSFAASGGQLDMNSLSITTVGDFTLENGTGTTMLNFDNTKISVGGDCNISGQSGDSLNLNATTACTLAVAGTLNAEYAVIANNRAHVSSGTAVNCRDAGGNTNWTFISDEIPPDNDMTLTATAIDSDKVRLSWNPSAIDSADADSVGIWYKTGDYPDSAYDISALAGIVRTLDDSIDTITGLQSKLVYYFSLTVRDSVGNWADTNSQACDTAKPFDKAPPDNDMNLTATAAGENKVRLSWNPSAVDSTDADSVGIWWSQTTPPESAFDANASGSAMYAISVTEDTITGLTKGTQYYFGITVRDSAGNWDDIPSFATDSATPVYLGPVWYVNAAAPAGGDGSISAPFDSAYKAFQNLAVNDSIRFAGGEYDSVAGLYISSDSVTVIGGYSGDFSQRDPAQYPTVLDGDSAADMFSISGRACRFDGFLFKNIEYTCLYFEYAGDGTVSNCRFYYIRKCINAHGAYNMTITNNIFAFDSIGIALEYYSDSVRIYNNTFHANDFCGIYCTGADSVEAINNIFSGNSYGIYEEYARLGTVAYNSFSGSAIADYGYYDGGSTIPVDADSVDALAHCSNTALQTPEYIDPSGTPPDLRLANSSPCIDAGDPSFSYANEPAPNGGRINLGAFGNTGYAAVMDTLAPDNDMTLSATAIDSDKVVLSWNPSAIDSTDADSVGIWYKTTDYPDSAYDLSALGGIVRILTDSVDTISGLIAKQSYYFSLSVRDSVGNWADTAAAACAAATPLDKTSPENVSSFAATHINADSVHISWTASSSTDAESVMVRYRTDGTWPAAATDGSLLNSYGTSRTVDTATGLAEKTEYRYAAFVKDSADNWSAAAADARDSVKTPDRTAPANVTALLATIVDTGSIALSWTPSVSTDAESVMVRYRTDGVFPSGTTDGAEWSRISAAIQVDTITGLLKSTTCHIGLFAQDSSGLWSAAHTDAQDTGTTSEVLGTVASPAVSPPGGSYIGSQSITITCNTGNASIYYTTDGATPTQLSTLYTGPITISSSATLKAVGTKNGYANSAVTTQTYSITQEYAQTPGTATEIVLDQGDSLSIPADACTSSVTIGVEYLASGTAPAHAGAQMLDKAFDLSPDGLHFNSPLALKVAYDSAGMASAGIAPSELHGYWFNDSLQQWEGVESEIDSVNHYITLFVKHFSVFSAGSGVAMPVVNPAGGPFDSAITVELSCATAGASIYYTLDGSEPDETSSLYSSALTLSSSTTLKAKGYKSGLAPSYTTSEQFDITIQPPEPVTGVSHTTPSCSTVVMSWTASTSTDVESVQVCGSLTAPPAAPAAGEIIKTVEASSTSLELALTPTGGQDLFVALFAKNSAGTWSSAAIDTVALTDCLAPDNNLTVSLASIGDSSIACTLSIDSTLIGNADRINITWNFGAAVTDMSTGFAGEYADTSFVIDNTSQPGLWYFATELADAAGNLSQRVHDSVEILNTPPTLKASPDTSISEDSIWNYSFSAYDKNADSIACALSSAPSGATLNNATLSWTPSNENVGAHNFIIACSDSRGGTTSDTFTVTVINVNDPPVAAVSGALQATEDSLYSASVKVTDPDAGDSASITAVSLPAWLTMDNSGTLSGTPLNEHVGIDTVSLVVTDDSGAVDSLLAAITVVNVNDAPSIVSNTFPDSAYEGTAFSAIVTASDIDRDDSLTLVWALRPSWMQASGPVSDGTAWKTEYSGSPAQADTGWNTYAFALQDRSGAKQSITDSLYIADRNEPPNTAVRAKTVRYGAVQYTVAGIDDYDSVFTFVTSMVKMDSAGTAQTPQLANNGTYEYYPLDDGTYLFSSYAIDSDSLVDSTPVRDTLIISGASQHTFYDTSGWHMISIPAQSYNADSIKAGGHLSTWDESSMPQEIYNYYKPSSAITAVTAGKGYWRKSSDRADIVVGSTGPVDTASSALLSGINPAPVDTPLSILISKDQYGWNQIGCPYTYPVKWSHDATLWKWDPESQDFAEAGNILEPWQAYWMLADSSQFLTIDNTPAFSGSGLAKQAKTFYAGKNEWRVQVVLKGQRSRDADNTLGFSEKAFNGYDRLDRAEPPSMGKRRYVFFPHEEWKRPIAEYASDIRRFWKKENIFQIGIAAGSEPVRVGWRGIDALSEVYLFMVRPDSGFQLTDDHALEIQGSSETQFRAVFASQDKNFLSRFPYEFAVQSPYPNPFYPVVNLEYTIPYRWNKNGMMNADAYTVSIRIFDARGRVVRTLVHRNQKPGKYKVTWFGRNNAGRTVASGAYFCYVKADKFKDVKRLTMLR